MIGSGYRINMDDLIDLGDGPENSPPPLSKLTQPVFDELVYAAAAALAGVTLVEGRAIAKTNELRRLERSLRQICGGPER